MATSDGWYLIGPLIALAMVAVLGVVFWRLGLDWVEGADDPLRERYGLSIFSEPDDAEEIRLLLADAGIRATRAVRSDGRYAVLVFAEEVETARRLVL